MITKIPPTINKVSPITFINLLDGGGGSKFNFLPIITPTH